MRFVCLSLFLIFAHASASIAASVDNIRIGAYQERTRIVFDMTGRPDFKVFALNNPNRVVVDLPSTSWNAPKLRPSGDVLGSHHAELKGGGVRVVLNMKAPTIVETSFFLPAAGGKPDRLVMDLTPDVKITAASKISPAPARKPKLRKKYRIVLDSGHGGRDPGAISGKVFEKNITLAIVKELARQLRADGRYEVFLTRSDDRIISLGGRVAIARKRKADLFISIHADTIDKSSVRGASIYTLSETSSDRQTAKLAAKENRADIIAGLDLSTQDKQVTSILIDLSQRDSTNKAGFIAETLVSSLNKKGVRTLENPHRFAGFAVLKAPDVPSILIEAGFLSNHQEVRELSKAAYRRKLSSAIKDGIDKYFDKLQTSNR